MSADMLPTIVGIALVAAAAAFALLPLVRGSTAEPSSIDLSAADRQRIYRQVLELEFDYELGKIGGDDYTQLRQELLTRAGEALRQEQGTLTELDREIEREIAAARSAFAAARSASNTSTPAGTPT
jgi:cytochrome c-type biogenesis protein CcmI